MESQICARFVQHRSQTPIRVSNSCRVRHFWTRTRTRTRQGVNLGATQKRNQGRNPIHSLVSTCVQTRCNDDLRRRYRSTSVDSRTSTLHACDHGSKFAEIDCWRKDKWIRQSVRELHGGMLYGGDCGCVIRLLSYVLSFSNMTAFKH